MTTAFPAPQAEFTPYLLRQAGLRASLLQSSFGFAAGDWDDLRQDLALDCLGRLPRFDASRGDWKGFVRGVVRNQACVLASRRAHGREFQPLDTGTETGRPDDGRSTKANYVPAEDLRPLLELSLDTERVLAGLPEELRTITRYLAEMPMSAVRRKTGLSLAQVNRRIRRIRAAFTAAGFAPASRGGIR